MRKFIISITFYLIIPAFLFGIAFELLVRNIPNHYVYKTDYMNKHAESIKVLILGSSHSYYGVNPAYLQQKSFSAANPSQSLNIDLEILKKYYSSLTNLSWIILPISYPSLVGTLENTESWRISNYIIYYHLNIHHRLIDNFQLLSGNFQLNLSRIISYYIFNNNDIGCSDSGWGSDYTFNRKLDLKETGKAAALRHAKKNFLSVDDNVAILKSIATYAKAKNIKVLLFTPPAAQTYRENLDSMQLNQAIGTAEDMQKSFSNVVYFNFLADSSFTESDFYDADHLDEFGAKKLTLKMDSIIHRLD